MNPINGKCHCGNITFEFHRPDFDPASDDALPVRSCTCSFCVKHGGVYTSHPEGSLQATIADDAEVGLYQFGTGTAHFYICRKCGIFPFVISEINGNHYAVVNVNTFENVDRSKLVHAVADFEGESVDGRLDRRTRTWIPAVTITSSTSS